VPTHADAHAAWEAVLSAPERESDLLEPICELARSSTEPTQVVFGTSGWRGIIGADYTVRNVRIVTEAVARMAQRDDAAILDGLGVQDFAALQRRGVIVGHDNRLMGPEFARHVIGVLRAHGIRTYYAGEAMTPEFSAGLVQLNAAASINLTPSHNPANYAGYKFNPSDGGPAGAELTSVVEEIANALMDSGEAPAAEPATPDEQVDLTEHYRDFLIERRTLDLDRIIEFARGGELALVVDHVHGASRGKAQRFLGEAATIRYLRTNEDKLFGGIAPEPSVTNMRIAEEALAGMSAPFKLGAIIDPDGDRIRFTDGTTNVPMNDFGAMALHYLHEHRGLRGCLVKSVATSNFANAIAEALGIEIAETPVGFKNFRPYMLPRAEPRAIVAFEESDGISGYNNTLEKDAMFGLLLAIEMVANTGKNLGAYLQELRERFGYFYPERAGIEVDRALAGQTLKNRLARIHQRYGPGDHLSFGEENLRIKDVIIKDGTKIVFEDDSWLLVRPSGTEPKVRFYVETRSEAASEAMFAKAEELTRDALAG